MSYPFERTVCTGCGNSVREDLQVGQQLHGVLIGFERRDSDWGPVVGEVPVMLIREGRTRRSDLRASARSGSPALPTRPDASARPVRDAHMYRNRRLGCDGAGHCCGFRHRPRSVRACA